ncbi:MAG: nitroreductase family deazaflavin-dependent oxidoreductase [Acidimicrobiia bacterium]
MPLPQSLARFNKKMTNRVTRPFVTWLPGFGLVIHRGRKSGRIYSNPVNVFRRAGGYDIALTYGQGDWVKNVLAAGSAQVHTRGVTHDVVNPRVVMDATHADFPAPVRMVLRLIEADEFLRVDATT